MSDLIKREDAEKIVTHCKGLHGSYVDDICEKLEALPSAERKGEWKDRTYGGRILHPWWESCECSQCEEWGSGAWNFCPHCGCRMKGADDGSR